MSMIQKPAPFFNAEAVLSNGDFAKISLSDFINKHYLVLFFYPLDFTFVCPSEILSFSNKIIDFNKRNTKILGISVDSCYSHYQWRNTSVMSGGIGEIAFPLVSDISKKISRDYNVLINDSVALRGTFIIDKKGIIRHVTLNDLPIGRNMNEVLRIVDALQFHEKHGEVCPAGWTTGKPGMKPNANGVKDYLKQNANKL